MCTNAICSFFGGGGGLLHRRDHCLLLLKSKKPVIIFIKCEFKYLINSDLACSDFVKRAPSWYTKRPNLVPLIKNLYCRWHSSKTIGSRPPIIITNISVRAYNHDTYHSIYLQNCLYMYMYSIGPCGFTMYTGRWLVLVLDIPVAASLKTLQKNTRHSLHCHRQLRTNTVSSIMYRLTFIYIFMYVRVDYNCT